MKTLKKILVILLKQLDLGSAVAVRLTKITGKSKEPIHPKHFLTKKPWFTKFIERKDIVLDLGCGNGQNTIKAAKVAKRVIGVDIDGNLLKLAKKSVDRLSIKNIKFEKSDVEKKINFKNNSFNKIIFLDVLEHLNNRDQILKGIKRILKPHGMLFLCVPNSQTSWKKLQRSVGICSYIDSDHKIEYSEDEIRLLLKKYRFEIKHFSYGKFDTPFRGLFDIIGGISLSLYKKLSMNCYKKIKIYSKN